MLAILSIVLATISAIVYLKKSQALCLTGIKNKWKYLLSLYGSVVFVNLIMVYLIFPAFANTNFQGNALGASVMLRNYSTIALKVNIPCSGHAYLVIDELKNINGVKDVKFRSPNLFDVYFDSRIISQEQILSLPIFEDFSATKVGN
jgi:copper chaperone CopZ